MRHWLIPALAVLALAVLALAGCSSAEPVPDGSTAPATNAARFNQAIGDIARPASDRDQDERRKPAELLAFAGIEKGQLVGDYIMGGGYMTRLLSIAVGSDGQIFAFQPTEFIAFRPAYADEQDEAVAPYGNVTAVRGPIAAPGFPQPLDTIITVMNFHDLYIDAMPAGTAETAIAALYDALKGGGALVVVDHSAIAGSGTAAADPLHRIDRQQVVDDLTRAGFQLEEESGIFARTSDPRDANVFADQIRGQSDKFALRFRKPG